MPRWIEVCNLIIEEVNNSTMTDSKLTVMENEEAEVAVTKFSKGASCTSE